MKHGVPQKGHPYFVFSVIGPVLGILERACPEHLELSLIACGLTFGIFIRPYTSGVSLYS